MILHTSAARRGFVPAIVPGALVLFFSRSFPRRVVRFNEAVCRACGDYVIAAMMRCCARSLGRRPGRAGVMRNSLSMRCGAGMTSFDSLCARAAGDYGISRDGRYFSGAGGMREFFFSSML